MHEIDLMGTRRSRVDEAREMGTALHDLCQPLTTLQCRLEMGELTGTAEAYRNAVVLGLAECARLATAVRSMREKVWAATREAEAEASGNRR